MRALREWLQRLWATLRPGRRDDDLEEELRLHLELVAEDARRRGLNADDAVRAARIEAGGSAQAMEALRDQRGLPWLEDVGRDVSYGLRTLRRSRGFTATAMLSLALGIGANTGIFSLVDHILLRLLPVREPDRLVLLDWNGPTLPIRVLGEGSLVSYPMCLDLQAQPLFDGVLCRHAGQVNFSAGQQYEVVASELVSGSYFSVLGVQPELGRLIGPADNERLGEHPIVVLSYDFWRNRLGAPRDIVGRSVLINKRSMTVIGVAAEGFHGMDVAQPAGLWMPAMMAREATLEFDRVFDRRAFWMQAFGRLKAGTSAEQASIALQPWFTSMLQADARREGFPSVSPEQLNAYLGSSLEMRPGGQGFSRVRFIVTRPLWALMAGTTLLLLLACLNVASLLLARGAERSQEMTTRMALGASPGRLARQLVVESLLVALTGGLLGLIAAPAVIRLLLMFMPAGADLRPVLDHRIFLFAFAASLVAGVLCGLAPAWQAGRRPLAASINSRSTAAGATVRFRKIIVGAQLAVTLVLLTGAGLFVQTLMQLQARDRGFDSNSLLMFRADPAGSGSVPADGPRVMQDLFRALQAAPAVDRVALANNTLLSSLGPGRALTIEADRRILVEQPVPMMRVSAGFFGTLGVPVIDGREFDDRDTLDVETTGFRSIVVNESFARRYFGRSSPVGHRVGFGVLPGTPVDVEIIGVVSDFRRRFLKDDAQPEHIFVAYAQAGNLAGDGTFYVRVRGNPESAIPAIRTVAAGVDPTLPLLGLTTAEDQVGRALLSETMLATLSSGFGAVALVLSVVGLFGVMSFVVTQRTQEIGMRMALGATRSAAIWLIIRDALATIAAGAAAGTIIGVLVTLAASSWLASVLYGVSPSDVATFAATTTMLIVVALAACVIPAGRAAVMSPMVAIRDQPESMWQSARLRVSQAMREMAASEKEAGSPGTLIGEVAATVHNAPSFAEAVGAALITLRDRVGAGFILLLEKSGNEYRSPECAIPANGLLVNRLERFPHPLPLTEGDLRTWAAWALEFRPAHVAEIERLARTGARMAVPLRTKSELVGVILLGPLEQREHFSAADKAVASGAADVFALLIENARLTGRALEQEKLRRDLALAAEVQRRLLPAQPPVCAAAAFAAFTLPARTVGGDYYDFLDLSGGRIGLAVADIAGKGIPAALLMSAVQASLRVLASEGDAVSQLAVNMNRFLHRSTATSSYATFFYAQLDFHGSRMRYVNAGHNPPYLVRRTSPVEILELSCGGTVLGLFPDVEYEEAQVDLHPGDLFVAFTDGVTEARNADGEEFGEERLQEFLRCAVRASSAEEISSTLADRIRAWIGSAEQHDDVTFVIASMK